MEIKLERKEPYCKGRFTYAGIYKNGVLVGGLLADQSKGQFTNYERMGGVLLRYLKNDKRKEVFFVGAYLENIKVEDIKKYIKETKWKQFFIRISH